MTCVFIVLIIVTLDISTPTKLTTGEIIGITCSIGIMFLLAITATGKNYDIFILPWSNVLSALVVVIIKKSSNHKGKLIQHKKNSTEPHCDTCERSDSKSLHKAVDNKEVRHSSSHKLSVLLSYNTQENPTTNNETSTTDHDNSHEV